MVIETKHVQYMSHWGYNREKVYLYLVNGVDDDDDVSLMAC